VSTKQDEILVFFQEIPWIDRHLPKESWFRQTNQHGRQALVQELTEFVMQGVLA
jgi:hypothetical protein